MKVFLLGAPGSGKTSLMAPLRERLDAPVLDMDDEVKRTNGGVWPSLDAKRGLTRSILAELSLLDDVLLAYSVLEEDDLEVLRAHDWRLVLLDVPEGELRARIARREAEQGWTNVEWLPFHVENIASLRARGAVDEVVDATLDPQQVVESILAVIGHAGSGGEACLD